MKVKSVKRLLAVLLCMGMAASAAACGGASDQEGDTKQERCV